MIYNLRNKKSCNLSLGNYCGDFKCENCKERGVIPYSFQRISDFLYYGDHYEATGFVNENQQKIGKWELHALSSTELSHITIHYWKDSIL